MSESIYKTIGTRIGACRVYRDMTRADLAEKAGNMSAKLVGRIERGTSEISVDRLVAIARALGVTSAVLTGEASFDRIEGGAAE